MLVVSGEYRIWNSKATQMFPDALPVRLMQHRISNPTVHEARPLVSLLFEFENAQCQDIWTL